MVLVNHIVVHSEVVSILKMAYNITSVVHP